MDTEIYQTICKQQFSDNVSAHKDIMVSIEKLDGKMDNLARGLQRVEDHVFNGLSEKITSIHTDLQDRRRTIRNTFIGLGAAAGLGFIGAATRWIFHLVGR
jgi:hypothetical protein